MVGRTVACVARPSVFVADTTRRTRRAGAVIDAVTGEGAGEGAGGVWFVPVRACSGNALRQRFVRRDLRAEWGNLSRKGYPIAGGLLLGTAIECAIELPLWDNRDSGVRLARIPAADHPQRDKSMGPASDFLLIRQQRWSDKHTASARASREKKTLWRIQKKKVKKKIK